MSLISELEYALVYRELDEVWLQKAEEAQHIDALGCDHVGAHDASRENDQCAAN